MRDNMRSPIIPLDMVQSQRAVPRELIIDYDKKAIYAVSPDDPNELINLTNSAVDAVIKYLKETNGDQITDISNTYVEIEGFGRVNISEVLEFLLDYGVDAIPEESLDPIILRKLSYDNASIIIYNNKVCVAGFREAGTDYIPMKKNGTIQWVPASMLPTKDGYTPNKYDVQDVMPIDGILQLTDNPVQKSTNIEGDITIKLPYEFDTNYCTIQWMVSVADIHTGNIVFNDNIKWKYNNDSILKHSESYIYTFETFDNGQTWYGKRSIFNGETFDDAVVTVDYLTTNFYTKEYINKAISWERLDELADDYNKYNNEAQFPNVINLAEDKLVFDNTVQFKFCTSETFYKLDTIHTNYLYFLLDTGELYRGPISFSNVLIKCREFPNNPTFGKIYFNTKTKELRYYDTASKEWLSLLTPMVDSLFSTDIDFSKVTATAKAVKDYIDYEIDKIYESLGKQEGYNTVPIFKSYDIAVTYAEGNSLARPGQCITAPDKNNPDQYVMYVIQPDKSLKEYPSMEQIKQLIAWKEN